METQTNPFEEALTKVCQNEETNELNKKSAKHKQLYRDPRNYAEKMIDILSWLFLVLGSIIFIVCIAVWFINDGDFSFGIVLYGFIGCFIGLCNFAILQVLRNISIKLEK